MSASTDCTVLARAGPLTTVQDRGRPGLAHLGVPRAGALDARRPPWPTGWSATPPTRRCWRSRSAGSRLRADAGRWVAVTGAPGAVPVGGAAGAHGERRVGAAPERELRLGPPGAGVRLLPRGRRRHRRARRCSAPGPPTRSPGSGPPRVGDGDGAAGRRRRPATPGRTTPRGPGGPGRCGSRPAPATTGSPRRRRRARAPSYAVHADSNRIGLRLAGAPLTRRADGELPSEGMVLGAVQVPPDGQPVVFLADHPPTGGYPVVGVVAPEDLWQCAQLRPGRRGPVHSGRRVRLDAGAERRVVDGVGRAPGPAGGLGGLEPHRHHAPARAPHPAAAHLGVHDVHARGPGAAPAARHLDRRRDDLLLGLGSSPRTGPPGSSRPARRRRRRAAGRRRRCRGRRAGRGPAGRSCARLSVGEGSVVERLRVVKSCSRTLIVPCGPTGRACAAARRPAGLPGQQPLHQLRGRSGRCRRCPRR